MKILQEIILAFIGLSGGVAVAAGVFALITMLGVIPRLAARSGSGKLVYWHETMILLGGTVGSALIVYNTSLPVGWLGMVIIGVLSGMFVGCLSMALAESLRVIPIFVRRFQITKGFPYLVLALALGKAFGTLYQLYFR